MKIPSARKIRLEKGPLPAFRVCWLMTLNQAVLLPEKLRLFPELALQVKKGLEGYSRRGFGASMDLWQGKPQGPSRTRIMGILNITPDSFPTEDVIWSR